MSKALQLASDKAVTKQFFWSCSFGFSASLLELFSVFSSLYLTSLGGRTYFIFMLLSLLRDTVQGMSRS